MRCCSITRGRAAPRSGWAGPGGRRVRRPGGGCRSTRDPVEARFLADASGRYALLGGRRIWTAPRTLALHARWRSGAPAEGPQTVVHALAEGWLWWAQLPHDEVRAMVLLDQDRLRAELAEPGRLFRRLVLGSERGADLLAGLPPTAPVAVCDASSYRFAEVVTSDAIRVGEAALRHRPAVVLGRADGAADRHWPRPPRSAPC